MAKKINRNEQPAQKATNSEPAVKRRMSLNARLCLVLAVLSFLLYANSLHNGYTMDDGLFITNNTFVNQGIKGIPALLTTPHLKGFVRVGTDTYRPLSLVLFAIENSLFGNDPLVGHFINLLLYAGCVALLFLFFNELMRGKTMIAFIATLLFAAHPIHTEVVDSIKSCDELLCFLFAFLSLNLFMSYTRTGAAWRLWVGGLCLFMALLSKETVICFIAIVPLLFYFYNNEHRRRSHYIVTCTVLAAAAFMLLRTSVMHGLSLGNDVSSVNFINNPLIKVPTGFSQLATAFVGMGYYIRLLFIPYPLLCSYAYNTIPFASAGNIWSWLSLCMYVSLAVTGIYRLLRIKNDLWALGLLFYLFSMALFSNVLFLVGALVAERFLFFGSVGFCLLAALAIEKLVMYKKDTAGTTISLLQQPKVLAALTVILVAYSGITIARNAEWESDYTLFKSDADNAPTNAKLACNVAVALNTELQKPDTPPADRQDMIETSLQYLHKALAIYPDNAEAHAGIGQLYLWKRQLDSAEAQEQKALLIDSTQNLALDNLAAIYFTEKKYPEAISCYKKLIAADPESTLEFRNIGLCYLYTMELDSSMHYLKKALSASPDQKASLYGPIGDIYKEQGKMDSALKYQQLMRQYDPTFKLHE